MSFLMSAARKTTDIRSFLREAAGNNSLKYKAEQGKKHYIHIPCITVPEVDEGSGQTVETKQIVARFGEVHEWETSDGKYRATICLKDVVRKTEDGLTVLNDGSCPICARTQDAWSIYKYRCDLEEKTCGFTGDALTKHMEGVKGANGMVEKAGFKKQAADERKAKEANPYLYLLIVLYRTDNTGNPTIGQNGLPEYDLKVMKLSKSRVEKIQQQIENSGLKMEGCDLCIEYPKEADNAALVVSKSTTAPIFPQMSITGKFPALAQAIQNDVEKFTWEGLEKSFPEWAGMTNMEAQKTVDDLFEQWDKYQKELAVNPNARYLEYLGAANGANNPAIGGAVAGALPGAAPIIPGAAPVVPGAAQAVPGVAPVVPGAAPTVPGVAQQVPGAAPVGVAQQVPGGVPNGVPGAAPVVPGAAPTVPGGIPGGIPDANSVFTGNKGPINL